MACWEAPGVESLERAYKQRDGGLSSIKADPLLKSLRGDPRFNALLRKMNLPERCARCIRWLVERVGRFENFSRGRASKIAMAHTQRRLLEGNWPADEACEGLPVFAV